MDLATRGQVSEGTKCLQPPQRSQGMAHLQGWDFVPPSPSSTSRPAPRSSPLPCSLSSWTCLRYKSPFAPFAGGSPAKLAMGRTGAALTLLTLLLLLPQPTSQFWLFNVLFPPTTTPEAPPTNSTPPVVLGKVTAAR